MKDGTRYNSKGGKYLIFNKFIFIALFSVNLSIAFVFWLRNCDNRNILIRFISKYKRMRFTRKYGVQIPPNTQIGPGLLLPHFLPIVVHPQSVIGKNATIHQFVTIAGNREGKAPKIGDNCFIGAGATIIGEINIGNNVTIAAGAVVTSDIPDNASVGGVPAKILHYNHLGKYIVNPVD